MINLYTPDRYRYITNSAEYNTGSNWKSRSYFGAGPGNDISVEGCAEDILYADKSIRNPVHTLGGVGSPRAKIDIAYTYLPFIITNTYTDDVYDIGFTFYNNPSASLAVAGDAFADLGYASQDAGASTSAIPAHNVDHLALFLIGAMDGSTYTAQMANLRNLQSTYWIHSYFGGLQTVAAPAGGNYVYLPPDRAEQAIGWWRNNTQSESFAQDGLSFSYNKPYWSWASGRTYYFFNSVTPTTAPHSFPILPMGGAMWGYLVFGVSNEFITANNISRDGSSFNVSTHGKWTEGDLAHNAQMAWSATTPYPGSSGTTYSRLIRFGMHIAGRKYDQ